MLHCAFASGAPQDSQVSGFAIDPQAVRCHIAITIDGCGCEGLPLSVGPVCPTGPDPVQPIGTAPEPINCQVPKPSCTVGFSAETVRNTPPIGQTWPHQPPGESSASTRSARGHVTRPQ